MTKPVEFCGSAKSELDAFPRSAKRAAGFQLRRVQEGLDPADWKPMPSIGLGVREIRLRDEAGAFRLIYVVNMGDRVYVLHAFQKKTQKTARADIDMAQRNLADLRRRTR